MTTWQTTSRKTTRKCQNWTTTKLRIWTRTTTVRCRNQLGGRQTNWWTNVNGRYIWEIVECGVGAETADGLPGRVLRELRLEQAAQGPDPTGHVGREWPRGNNRLNHRSRARMMIGKMRNILITRRRRANCQSGSKRKGQRGTSEGPLSASFANSKMRMKNCSTSTKSK